MPHVYCGTKVPIPLGYPRTGTAYECLRKGVGVGKYLLNGPRNNDDNYYPLVELNALVGPLLFIIIIWIVILFLSNILVFSPIPPPPPPLPRRRHTM